jgi:hypothetical protein
VLALVRVCPRVWLGRSVHGLCRGQCLMVVVGRENGGDPVIEQKVFGTGRTGRAIPTVDDAVKPPSGSHYGLSLGILTADVARPGVRRSGPHRSRRPTTRPSMMSPMFPSPARWHRVLIRPRRR